MSELHSVDRTTDEAFFRYREERSAFWNGIATMQRRTDLSGYYHDRLDAVYGNLVQPGKTVLELGSGNGHLLEAVAPSRGLGLDFASDMVKAASEAHPNLKFIEADVHQLDVDETFDYVILSDLVNDLWDVQAVFDRIQRVCTPDTRVILNFYNRLWQMPLTLARRLRLAKPSKRQNWLSVTDVKSLLAMAGFEVVSETSEILIPLRIPLVTGLLNRVLVKIWPLHHLGLTQFVVARPKPPTDDKAVEVSVVVPARNESGHIRDIVGRTPQLGAGTELIFVEGNSTDDTYDVIKDVIGQSGRTDIRLYQQPGVGKGDAVRHGFDHATGEILMILDADITVAPEELTRFYRAIIEGHGEFINGVRLVYPMESEAMRFLNYLGNKFFGVLFSWLLRQRVKDTLCGTKVLRRGAYDAIVANRSYFGDFDPFGDFDLLFGAARLNLKIVDVPVRYRERSYGTTNIDRWRHGWLLLRMAWFAARRLRFI